MWTITNRKELQELANTRALVSVYLDHAYTDEKISLILGSRRGFDFHVGPAWHLLIPFLDGGYVADAPLDSSKYNIGFARGLIDEYGLRHSDLPALVFLGSSGADDTFSLKLAGMTNEEILDIVGTIGDISKDELKDGLTDPVEFRRRVNNVVLVYLNRKKIVRTINKVAASPIVGLVGLGTGLIS